MRLDQTRSDGGFRPGVCVCRCVCVCVERVCKGGDGGFRVGTGRGK